MARLMRDAKTTARRKRPFVRTTDSKHDNAVAPNVPQRNFTTDAPNKAWVTDIRVPQISGARDEGGVCQKPQICSMGLFCDHAMSSCAPSTAASRRCGECVPRKSAALSPVPADVSRVRQCSWRPAGVAAAP